MTTLWPWLALAGLGAFHGLNPAMGWLFAVGLALNRGERRLALTALGPIAAGHAASIALVGMAAFAFGLFVAERPFRLVAGAALVAMAAWMWATRFRHRLRVGMRTGFAGLALWSFLMATGHGAGLMLIPALMPICFAGAPGAEIAASGAPGLVIAAVGVHMAAMLAVMAAVALAVHDLVGLDVLRRGWLNLDLVWCAALVAAGVWVMAS